MFHGLAAGDQAAPQRSLLSRGYFDDAFCRSVRLARQRRRAACCRFLGAPADGPARRLDAASAAFSRSLEAPLALAWRGAAETGALTKALTALAANPAANAVAVEAKALTGKLKPSDEPGSGFVAESGVLAGLENAAENSDSPPSAAMLRIRDEVIARVTRDAAAWQAVRASDLAAFNRSLIKAGLKPIVIPLPSELEVTAPDGGQDLP